MKSNFEIALTFRLNKSWKQILLGTLLGVVFYQITNLLRPNHGNLQPLFEGRIWDYFKEFVAYYLCFEWISVLIFMYLSLAYTKIFKMRVLSPGWWPLFVYNLNYLPVIFISILVFAPLTNGLRYLAYNYPDYSITVYFPEYFLQGRMYIRYLVPLFFLGLGYLNYNIFLDFNDWQKQRFKDKLKSKTTPEDAYMKQLKVIDNQGESFLEIKNIKWMSLENKSYMVYAGDSVFKTKLTITELEEKLNPNVFFRINRATIINLKHMKNYSFWEYDKYVVRMDDNKTEFVMQRARLKDLKELLEE
jgi:two-component system, LytTR family, response regulator